MATSPATGQSLLARLHALFQEDPAIDEIGLLFGVDADELTVETAFVLAEHKLGVAFSAGPLLFRAARTRFHALNAKLRAAEIGARDSKEGRELLACSRAVLLISADFYTAWNTRKEYVRRGWLDAASEVAFTDLVFSLHPKSIDTWAYRRWLATQLCDELKEAGEAALDAFFEAQVTLCGVLTERFPRNYHAWSFRHWIVSRFDRVDQLEKELQTMQRWCETHLKDHSGWNHRQHTIKCLLAMLASRSATDDDEHRRFALLLDEFEFLSGILTKFPVYEALWCHRRYVLLGLLNQQASISASEFDAIMAAAEKASDAVASGEITQDCDLLGSCWVQVRSSTSHSTIFVCALEDIAIAWRCGNRFARRYAMWLLERLRANMVASQVATNLDKVDRQMRTSLVTDDALLDHLWQSPSIDV